MPRARQAIVLILLESCQIACRLLLEAMFCLKIGFEEGLKWFYLPCLPKTLW